jgi:hypothetical protein
MRRPRREEAGVRRLLAAALALLVLAGLSGWELVRRREAAGIPVSPSRVALGGFEPLAVNLLWLRAESFRDAGRLTESTATWRLLTEIEPHVAEGWAFPAWMLVWTEARSGNPEREWSWVRRGLDLLERGLEFNPGSEQILMTLGLVYYRRLATEPEIYAVARERLGRRPEQAAVEVLERLAAKRPGLLLGTRADSWRLLGERRLADGDRAGAREAFARALPLWRRIVADKDSAEAERIANEIRSRLDSLR